MIPIAHIIHWRQFAPWSDDLQVEQDLILSRIIVEIFSDPFLSKELAFRGGTALHKLFFTASPRYSEDIDLVRTGTGAIKEIIDALHNVLNPWLGEPKTERNVSSFKMRYFFAPESVPNMKVRIKIEINTRESFTIFGYLMKSFGVESDWFTGKTQVRTFQLEELIATKLRALYQRKKGRDLFDLWLALKEQKFDIAKAVNAFNEYIKKQESVITRKLFEKNLQEKLQDYSFTSAMNRLLSIGMQEKHAKLRLTEQNEFHILEDGEIRLTEGWSLFDAAEEVRDKILIYLPE